ncbi:hypothetical protein BKA93DRAFT_828851 [Sparassis latifolia]|uniref:F-box domain-containing protein n=1 Tax=Sparassis crispa TaxID=139825 RepID=A0A401GTF1_9APHY|nr:hypothetical protein SCP_0706460 [Sparassis crispa]GBE85459.1 hypothetical protein SCP_0706460 [Sparassis crispa]
MTALPAELCNQIVHYSSQRDLFSLCLTSKALQRATEARIYECIFLRDMGVAYRACRAIVGRGGVRGAYVKRFWFSQDTRRLPPRTMVQLPPQFWQAVQDALTKMVNLDFLLLNDPANANTWVLSSPTYKFQLREASFQLPWDAEMVAFLQTQNRLRVLHTEDSFEDGPLPAITPGKLQSLQVYNGPVLVVAELMACPLTHLQIMLEEDTAVLLGTVVTDLGRSMKTLRSLNVAFMPEHYMLETLQLISTSVFAPTLRHLGILPIPYDDRSEVHRCLMRLPALHVLEVDVFNWEPQPVEVFQRMLASELRIYCPSLRYVSFWVGQHHLIWHCVDEEWTSCHFSPRHPQNETLWRTV